MDPADAPEEDAGEPTESTSAGRPFSEELQAWLDTDEPKTLGALDATFGERSFAVAVLLLMFLPAVPIPTGGITHLFEAITVVIAAQLVVGRRTLWLPKRWKHRELGDVTTEKALPWMMRRIRWFEKFSRNRGAHLFDNVWVRRLLGLIFIAFAVLSLIHI